MAVTCMCETVKKNTNEHLRSVHFIRHKLYTSGQYYFVKKGKESNNNNKSKGDSLTPFTLTLLAKIFHKVGREESRKYEAFFNRNNIS